MEPTPVFLLENPMDRGAWQAAVHGVINELEMTKQLNNTMQSLGQGGQRGGNSGPTVGLSDSWAHHPVKPPTLPGFMCPHWHAHHQGYSNSLGSVGAQPMVVEVYVGLLHVPDEVGDGHYAHQFAGLQVQLLLSSGEKFLGICKKIKRCQRKKWSFSSSFALSSC